MPRSEQQVYPDFTAELKQIEKDGITSELLKNIIYKHRGNAVYNRSLYKRYSVLSDGVPIFKRKPAFSENPNEINNKVNNDFFSEIVDFKTGYFAGTPISYSYSRSEEAEEATGGKDNVKEASKVITDFVARNNMFDVDMETTKFASIYGYTGRLFYIDSEGNERVMPVPGYETIIISNRDITEPQYAIRYYPRKDINGKTTWTVEFYDETYIYTYSGDLGKLEFVEREAHLFDYCPLQGIPNNKEMLGDAEKVLSAIDDYDKVLSDDSNEIEGFVHAYMVFRNITIDDKTISKAQKTGALSYRGSGTDGGEVSFLTKDINDSFTEHHLNRLEDNIYRFSKTPNLTDETFGAASGVSLKFKLHGLETKCGMFEAKMISAGTYMFKLLASSWAKKKIIVDPLQCVMEFSRNFPLDLQSEAAAVQQLIAAGIPKRVAYSLLSFVDDVDYIMQLIEEEKEAIPSLTETTKEDEEKETERKGE